MRDTLDRKQKKRTGERADKIVQRAFPGLTGSQVDEALEAGWIRLTSGESLQKGTRLDSPQLDFSLLRARLELLRLGNSSLELPVLAENPDFWVVDKPAGLAGHPLRLAENETVTHWALARDPGLVKEFPAIQPTLTPHRLDTGTSGLLLVARTRESYQTWRYRFEARAVLKQIGRAHV